MVSSWFVKRVDLTRRIAQRFVRFALLLWAATLITQLGENLEDVVSASQEVDVGGR